MITQIVCRHCGELIQSVKDEYGRTYWVHTNRLYAISRHWCYPNGDAAGRYAEPRPTRDTGPSSEANHG
jgi:hypothetical protein